MPEILYVYAVRQNLGMGVTTFGFDDNLDSCMERLVNVIKKTNNVESCMITKAILDAKVAEPVVRLMRG